MDLISLRKSYTAAPPGSYRWYVGVYNVFLEETVTHIEQSDKSTIFDIFRKLRDEHTINWSRNYLYEFREEKRADVLAILLKTLHRTDSFDVLKVCLYLLRNIRKNRVLDNYVLQRIPELKAVLENYTDPIVGGLQRSVMRLSKSEHSMRDLESILISNRGYGRVMEDHVRKVVNRYHLTNMGSIELELTTDCNLKCFNCDKICGKAESTESMTVGQVKKFIAESRDCGKEWGRIALTGGEPTLHPDIMEIVGLVLEYRNSCLPKSSFVQIVSNGYGQAEEVLNRIQSTYTQEVFPSSVSNRLIRNNGKRNKVVLHSPVNMAPVDNECLKGCDFRNGCWVTETAGLGLTRHGYYFCGTGAAIDRVFGYNIGIQDLREVCMHRFIGQRSQLCRLCGRFNDLSISPELFGPNWVIEEGASATWVEALKSYRERRPVLTLF